MRRSVTWPVRHPVLAALLAVAVVVASFWAFRLVGLTRSVDDSAAYWSQPRGEPGGLLHVALGDSAAQGIGASRPSNGYVGVLGRRLATETGQPIQVVNLSRSGARIRDVVDTQLPALAALGRTPDLVTVAIGGNDVRAYDPARFAADSAALARALPAGAYVADVPYFMHGRWESNADEAARVLTDDARENGLRVVPLHEVLRDQGWQAMLTQFAADWFHPNDRGHRVWAEAFWDAIAAERPASSTAGGALRGLLLLEGVEVPAEYASYLPRVEALAA